MNHSPEPWTERLDNPFNTPFDGYFRIIAADSTHVATVPTSTDYDCKPFGPGKENKRRILACVNFLREFPTEYLTGRHAVKLPTDPTSPSLADIPGFDGLMVVAKDQ